MPAHLRDGAWNLQAREAAGIQEVSPDQVEEGPPSIHAQSSFPRTARGVEVKPCILKPGLSKKSYSNLNNIRVRSFIPTGAPLRYCAQRVRQVAAGRRSRQCPGLRIADERADVTRSTQPDPFRPFPASLLARQDCIRFRSSFPCRCRGQQHRQPIIRPSSE